MPKATQQGRSRTVFSTCLWSPLCHLKLLKDKDPPLGILSETRRGSKPPLLLLSRLEQKRVPSHLAKSKLKMVESKVFQNIPEFLITAAQILEISELKRHLLLNFRIPSIPSSAYHVGFQEDGSPLPSEAALSHPFGILQGLAGSSSPAGPLVSALPAPKEATPTHRAGPSSAGSSALHTSYLPSCPPTHPLPSLVSGIPLPRVQFSFPHPRQRLGQGWGVPLLRRAGRSEANTVMRKKEGGGCVSQPGLSACWECTEPRNPGLSPNLSSHTGTHLSTDQAAKGSRCSG